MSTHNRAEGAPAPSAPRGGSALRILVQAGFILLACLACTVVLVVMMEGQLTDRYVETLRGEIMQYSEMAAGIVPPEAVADADGEAIAYLDAFLASLFSAFDTDPGADFGYALYRLEGDAVQYLVLGPTVSGPSGSAEEYLAAAASEGATLLDDGRHLSALYPVRDGGGKAVGIVEVICDWTVFTLFADELRRNILLACGIGVACMLAVYFLMALFAALRERGSKGGDAA